MRKTWIAAALLACVCVEAVGQRRADEIRLLKAEVNLLKKQLAKVRTIEKDLAAVKAKVEKPAGLAELKTQIAALAKQMSAQMSAMNRRMAGLEKKLASAGPIQATKRTSPKRTRKPSKRSKKPSLAPAADSGAKGAGGMRIVDNDPAWWQNPSGLVTQLDLRKIMGRQNPEQAAEAWLARNKGFEGKELAWLLAYKVGQEMDKRVATRQHMRKEGAVEKQKDKIEKMRSRGSRRGGNAEGDNEAVRAEELKLAKLEAEERLWARVANGGVILDAVYIPEPKMASGSMARRSLRRGRSARRRGASPGAQVSVQLAVPADQLDKLFDYEDGLAAKYSPVFGGRWPIIIRGTLDYLSYDGGGIAVIVDGSWEEVPAGRVKLDDRPRGMLDDDEFGPMPGPRGRGRRGRGARQRGRGRRRRMAPDE